MTESTITQSDPIVRPTYVNVCDVCHQRCYRVMFQDGTEAWIGHNGRLSCRPGPVFRKITSKASKRKKR